MNFSDGVKTSAFFLLSVFVLLLLPLLPSAINGPGQYGLKANHRVPMLFEGKPNVVLFGYGLCNDACPPQLATMHRISELVKAGHFYFVFVSLAPSVDRSGGFSEVVQSLGEDFRIVLPEDESTARALAQKYRNPVGDSSNMQFDHSATIHVVDPQGTRVLMYPSLDLDVVRMSDELSRMFLPAPLHNGFSR